MMADDGLPAALAARLGCGPAVPDAVVADLAGRRGPAQCYQHVVQLALLCSSRPDAVEAFLVGMKRLSRRRYWTGGVETLAIDCPAMFALAVGVVDLQRQDDAGWLVELIEQSKARMGPSWDTGLLEAALFLLGRGGVDRIPADVLSACAGCGLLDMGALSPAMLATMRRVAQADAEGNRERAVVQAAALTWLKTQGPEREPMYALTLHRPWPWAIFHAPGRPKRVENRTWKPPARAMQGRIAIHAGKRFDREAVEFIDDILAGVDWTGGRCAEDHCPRSLDQHPTGIIGTARVVGWVQRNDGLLHRRLAAEAPTWAHAANDSPWFVGPFGWVLDDVRPLAQPVDIKGAQGLWKVPADVLQAIDLNQGLLQPDRAAWNAANRRAEGTA